MKGRLARFLRLLRLENDEYLKDMASKTGVSISFLSAVENETKKMSGSITFIAGMPHVAWVWGSTL